MLPFPLTCQTNCRTYTCSDICLSAGWAGARRPDARDASPAADAHDAARVPGAADVRTTQQTERGSN
ncbi:hypothetical protein BVIET440_10231 [Burkholderia vietnamiensis]